MFHKDITSKHWTFFRKASYEPWRFRIAVCLWADMIGSLTQTPDIAVTEYELKVYGWLPPSGHILAGYKDEMEQKTYFLIEAEGFPITTVDEPLPMDTWSAEEKQEKL